MILFTIWRRGVIDMIADYNIASLGGPATLTPMYPQLRSTTEDSNRNLSLERLPLLTSTYENTSYLAVTLNI